MDPDTLERVVEKNKELEASVEELKGDVKAILAQIRELSEKMAQHGSKSGAKGNRGSRGGCGRGAAA